MVYYVSDMFFDNEVISKKRHFSSPSDMNSFIISNWNKVVYPTDEVYILGGIGSFDYLNSLNGEKIIIMSEYEMNHFREYVGSISDSRDNDLDFEIYEAYLKKTYGIKKLCKSRNVIKKLYSGRVARVGTQYVKCRDNVLSIIGIRNELQRMFNPSGINSNIMLNGYFPLSEVEIEELLHYSDKLL